MQDKDIWAFCKFSCNLYYLYEFKGIGYETAMALASRGCRLIIADKDNCDETKATIINNTGNTNITTKQFNLASLKSVRCLADDINKTEERLDILINNAGATGLGNSHTEDHLHKGIQVNHFGSFLLTHLLIKLMKKSKSARIIFVSSLLAFISNLTVENLNFPSNQPSNGFSNILIYSNSKLCNILTAVEFSKKLKGCGITVNSVHPGIVDTRIYKTGLYNTKKHPWKDYLIYYVYRCLLKPFSKTPSEGAQTTLHVALAKELENTSGQLFVDCKPFIMPRSCKNSLFSKAIWEASETFVQLSPEEKL